VSIRISDLRDVLGPPRGWTIAAIAGWLLAMAALARALAMHVAANRGPRTAADRAGEYRRVVERTDSIEAVRQRALRERAADALRTACGFSIAALALTSTPLAVAMAALLF